MAEFDKTKETPRFVHRFVRKQRRKLGAILCVVNVCVCFCFLLCVCDKWTESKDGKIFKKKCD